MQSDFADTSMSLSRFKPYRLEMRQNLFWSVCIIHMAIIIAERAIVVKISSVEGVDQDGDEHQQEKDAQRDVPEHSLPATDFEILETNDS